MSFDQWYRKRFGGIERFLKEFEFPKLLLGGILGAVFGLALSIGYHYFQAPEETNIVLMRLDNAHQHTMVMEISAATHPFSDPPIQVQMIPPEAGEKLVVDPAHPEQSYAVFRNIEISYAPGNYSKVTLLPSTLSARVDYGTKPNIVLESIGCTVRLDWSTVKVRDLPGKRDERDSAANSNTGNEAPRELWLLTMRAIDTVEGDELSCPLV